MHSQWLSSYFIIWYTLVKKDARQPKTIAIGTGCPGNKSKRLRNGGFKLFKNKLQGKAAGLAKQKVNYQTIKIWIFKS